MENKETLEEDAETEFYITINKIIDGGKDLPKGYSVTRGQAVDYAFKIALEVVKWQQQQNKNLYNEEEVFRLILARNVEFGIIEKTSVVKEWFEKFKKK